MHFCIFKNEHIALTEDDVFDGGTWRFLVELRLLLDLGHTAEVWTTDVPSAPSPTGLTVHTVAVDQLETYASRGERDYNHGAQFVRAVFASPDFSLARADLLLTHHWASAIAIEEFVPNGFPWVHTPHLLAHSRMVMAGDHVPESALAAEREVLQACTLVVALSKAEESDIRGLEAGCTTLVVPNPVDPLLFDRSGYASDGVRIPILTIARLVPQKGISNLLETAELARQTGRPYDFRLIAPPATPANESLEHSITRSSITQVLHPTRAQLRDELTCSAVYMQPSLHETQGIAILEAMAAGCAIVATPTPAVAEYLDARTGVLVDSRDAKSFLEAIDFAVANLDRLATESVRLARTFSTEAFGHLWVNAIGQAMLTGQTGPQLATASSATDCNNSAGRSVDSRPTDHLPQTPLSEPQA